MERKTGQSWAWAIGINLVVFLLLWGALIRIPPPSQAAPKTAKQPKDAGTIDTGPGNTFGQITQHTGSASTAGGGGDNALQNTSATGSGQAGQWINEFYLDLGPAISFAPRLNPDGTPRSLPGNQEFTKAPTYEDEDKTLTPENTNPPKMNPKMFSKAELPEELRKYTYQLTVQVQIDARGKVEGRPVILKGSNIPMVDQLTIKKIMNDVKFTPASRKDTGQPVRAKVEIPIFWN